MLKKAIVSKHAGLVLLAVVAIWVGILVGFVSLTLVVQRLVAGGALASGAFLFSSGILSLSLLEAVSRGRVLSLLTSPTAIGVFAIGALGFAWIVKEIAALRRQRYLLTTRRAAALRGEGKALLWSVALGDEYRGVRPIWPLSDRQRGHVAFGFGQVEGDALCFGQTRNKEYKESNRLEHDIPEPVLCMNDVG